MMKRDGDQLRACAVAQRKTQLSSSMEVSVEATMLAYVAQTVMTVAIQLKNNLFVARATLQPVGQTARGLRVRNPSTARGVRVRNPWTATLVTGLGQMVKTTNLMIKQEIYVNLMIKQEINVNLTRLLADVCLSKELKKVILTVEQKFCR